MDLLQNHFDHVKQPGPYSDDILEHLETLKKYASECKHVTEFGFRMGTSFTALLMGQPKRAISYDISLPPGSEEYFKSLAPNIDISLIQRSTIDPELEIEETDLLMIDTLHNYDQLKQELKMHGKKAKKYIVFHDVVTFGYWGENNKTPGLLKAIEEFRFDNPEWKIDRYDKNNNGMMYIRNCKNA